MKLYDERDEIVGYLSRDGVKFGKIAFTIPIMGKYDDSIDLRTILLNDGDGIEGRNVNSFEKTGLPIEASPFGGDN